MPDILLAEIPLSSRDVLRVTKKGAIVHLRRWFATASGEMRPGRDGVSFGADVSDALLVALGSIRSGKP